MGNDAVGYCLCMLLTAWPFSCFLTGIFNFFHSFSYLDPLRFMFVLLVPCDRNVSHYRGNTCFSASWNTPTL